MDATSGPDDIRSHGAPQRMAGGVGLVIERARVAGEKDGLQWYCDTCNHQLYDERFVLKSIEKDFPPVFDRFFSDVQKRTCAKCGTVMDPPARK